MDKNGYYLTRCALGEDVVDYNQQNGGFTFMANMCFAMKCPADISDIVRKSPYIYHATSETNAVEIMRIGLHPKARSSEYHILNQDIHYPERTYFFYGMLEVETLDYAKQDMDYGTYHLLQVKTDNLPKELPIFYDQLVGGNAIYLEYSIPPQYIEDIQSFRI